MNKLIIHTQFPGTVAALLKTQQLVDGLPHFPTVGATEDLEVYYPDDLLSQSLTYWFALAQGCGLVESYQLFHQLRVETQEDLSAYFIELPVSELHVGDIFCPPSGNPPGTITRIYRDPLTASNDYPLITFEYEGNVCGKRICDIRQDQMVRVYRGELKEIENAWVAEHGTHQEAPHA